MAGVLIVEGDESEPYDADIPIVLRDWRIDETSGEFLPFFTPEGAGKGGHVRHDPQRQRRNESGDLLCPPPAIAGSDCSTSTTRG